MDLLIILRRTGVSALLVLMVAWMPTRGSAASLEYPVKAAYLSKFGIYVEWPPGMFASSASPLVLCVAGSDPFGATLDQATAGQHIDGHPVVVKRVDTANAEVGCQILYVGFDDAQSRRKALDAVRGKPVLTVVDADDGGGIIRFVISDNRVRFNIDEAEATRSGLKISSKLLNLALNVHTR